VRLVRAVGAVAVVWCAAWAALALMLPGAAERARAALEARGWQVEVGPVRARGLPLAIAADAGPAAIALPGRAGVLRTDRLALSAPLLAPVTFVSREGGGLELSLDGAGIGLAAEVAEIEAAFRPTPALTFRRASLRMSGVEAALPAGTIRAERAEARLAARPGEPAVIGLEAEVAGIGLPAAMLARIAARGALPRGLPRLVVAAEALFSAPWDRAALARRPQPMRLAIRRAAVEWGGVVAEAEGLLRIDPEGRPEGEVRLALPDAGAALALAAAAGLLPERLAAVFARAAPAPRAAAAAGPRRFALAFSFRDGRVFLGGADLGPAPLIRLP
jgi:hypothetical protein